MQRKVQTFVSQTRVIQVIHVSNFVRTSISEQAAKEDRYALHCLMNKRGPNVFIQLGKSSLTKLQHDVDAHRQTFSSLDLKTKTVQYLRQNY